MHAAKNFFRNYSRMIPTPMHPNPLHFLSRNDDGYADEALHVLLLQITFCYVIPVGSILFMFSAFVFLIIVPCVALLYNSNSIQHYIFVTTSSKFKIALHTTTIAAVSGLLCLLFTPIISQVLALFLLNFSKAFLYRSSKMERSF